MKDFIKNKIRENIENNQVSQYKAWLSSVAKPVRINPITNIVRVEPSDMYNNIEKYQKNLALSKSIKTFLIENIEPNECFHNAGKVLQFFKNQGFEVSFVLGILIENGKKFGHAWNKINGVYYDFTAEKSEKIKNKYFEVASIDNELEIQSLDVFNPNAKCEHEFNVDGESYDVNGMCSVYPYFIKTTQ
jgi:hypothetical protein